MDEREHQKFLDDLTWRLREAESFVVVVSTREPAPKGEEVGGLTFRQYWKAKALSHVPGMVGTLEDVKLSLLEEAQELRAMQEEEEGDSSPP